MVVAIIATILQLIATTYDHIGQFTPNGYTAPTNLSSGVSVVEGGYVRAGNLIVINCRLSITGNVNTICSFPAPGLSYTHVSVTNNKNADIGINQDGTMISVASITGTLIVMAVYFMI